MCVVLQVKRSFASPLSVKFVNVQVIHFQDLGFFLQILVFLSFFGLSLYLQVVMVNHFGIISGAKFFLGSVFYSVLL